MEELLNNIYDVLAGNDKYCTQKDFIGEVKYMGVDLNDNCIRIETKDGYYKLTINKEG